GDDRLPECDAACGRTELVHVWAISRMASSARTLRSALLAVSILVACGSGESTTPGKEAGSADSAEDGGDRGDDSGASGGIEACSPACDPGGSICCVDQHGHFPRCVDGSQCEPPLQPP